MATTETPEEALARIQSMGWGKNDAIAIMAFADAGIDPEEITPRQNVLTFRAWKAAGRQVAKGAISVRVTVWIAKQGKGNEEAAPPPKDGENTAKKGCMWPKTTSLFHVSQTIPKGAEKGTRPDAWANPALVREGTYEAPQQAVQLDSGKVLWVESDSLCDDPPVVPPEPPADFNPLQPEPEEKGDFGATGDDRPGECICPMVGCVTHASCPIHGEHTWPKVTA